MMYFVLSFLISFALGSGFGSFGFDMNGGFGGGFGAFGIQNRFSQKQGVTSHQAQISQLFSDGLDSKPLAQFIAAGMLPRYAPMNTDGVDTSDRWLGGFNGETEEQVIQMAKARYPMSAQLGHPENEELLPIWHQVVLAGLTRAPDHAGSNPNTRSH